MVSAENSKSLAALNLSSSCETNCCPLSPKQKAIEKRTLRLWTRALTDSADMLQYCWNYGTIKKNIFVANLFSKLCLSLNNVLIATLHIKTPAGEKRKEKRMNILFCFNDQKYSHYLTYSAADFPVNFHSDTQRLKRTKAAAHDSFAQRLPKHRI